MTISLVLALKNVIRRPRQNAAVILGIALGVSLFVGVQVGTDSLGAGLYESSIHSLGETDASIYSQVTPFFVTEGIITEELNASFTSDPLINELRQGDHMQYVKSLTERLELSVTALDPKTGSTEISRSLKGIPENEQNFGELINEQGDVLELQNLAENEIYIGMEMAELLFLDTEPRGKNLTLQTTIFSLGGLQTGINSTAVSLQLNVTIIDVFIDEGKGRENFSNYIAAPLSWLQGEVSDAFDRASLAIPQPVLGYGGSPITSILINWKDNVELGVDSSDATAMLKQHFNSLLGPYSQLYQVEDTRAVIEEQTEAASDSLATLLNIFGYVIIAAGVLVIVNIQNMALAAREKETGIMRAVGASQRQIVISNLAESMFLGIIGSLIGLLGGIGYGRLLVFFLGVAFEFPVDDIPTVVTFDTLVLSFIAGFLISQVTGLLPAISASRIDVAQVLRGIDPPDEESFGRKSLYAGILFTIIAVITFIGLDPNPLYEGRNAFRKLENTEASYLPIASLVIGPALLFAYYKSKKVGLTVLAIFVSIWAYFNIFVIFDFIEEGSGGLNYVGYLIASLVGGSIILVSVNLNSIAAGGQKLASWLARSRETPIRGTTMVAFRKMRSNVTRSTLTFALFAVILTLNIFIGSWSYSFRYGYDSLVTEVSGGADVLIFSGDNTIPEAVGIEDELLSEFGTASRDVRLTNVRAYTLVNGPSYIFGNRSESAEPTKVVSISDDGLWTDSSQNEELFRFNLFDNKTNTPFEIYEDQPDDPAFTSEDEAVWRALANGGTIPNIDGVEKPMIITSPIATFENNVFNQTKYPGDSIWLNLTDGSLQEFVIAATAGGNPLADFQGSTAADGPPSFSPTMYIPDEWKNELFVFSGLSDQVNILLGETNVDDIKSSELPRFLTEIETWANQEDGEFRQEHGLFGIIGVPVYDIYEAQLEGQYRFFGFLQAFVSIGFAVGILGLLVVASRSVAERTREIGMLRALGFRRSDIVVSVVLELIVMGLIGLALGFLNGIVLGYALTDINSGGDATFLIPWGLVSLYGIVTLVSAIIAAIFPAIRASKIPPSEALRYTG